MKKKSDHYKLLKKNHGTAIILSLVIVSVLFILTSFLVRTVVTNTTMVEKTGDEQESYALAKEGILYALDKLNTWEGTDPDYDPTAWLNGENWDEDNWNPFDLNSDGENDVQIRLDKDDIPHPDDPAFDSIDDDNGDLDYITIESQDLPKKLVTLQAITKNTSPLLKYVRFLYSDATFGDNTFGPTGSGSLIEGDARLCVLGNVTWESGSSNNLILSDSDSKAIVYGTISNGGGASLKINGNDPQSGYYYFFDPNDSSYDDPALFDTADGHYFSLAHLPSCYDYSSGTPTFYYGSTEATFWPQINEDRYKNLADLLISASDCGSQGSAWNDWYPSDDKYGGSYASGYYWRQEGSGYSYNYTPPGVHLIFSDAQDLNPSTSATTERLMRVNDADTTDLPAEYETSASISYPSFTSEDIIFCEKDVRVNGVLPRDLTIASGGNIYIDSNIYTNGHSLALLAKENILLNTTHRWVVDYEVADNWTDGGTTAANLVGVTDGQVAQAQVNIGESKEQILNLGGGTSRQIVTTDRIVLRGCEYDVYADNTLSLSVEVDLGDGDWRSASFVSGPPFPINGPASGSDPAIVFATPSDFRNFSRIKLTVTGGGTGSNPAGSIAVDGVEVPIADMNRTAVFAENGSWYVIPGNGTSPYNDQQEPFTIRGALSQEELEETDKWNDGSPGGEADWDRITYIYDSDLVTTPLAFPPSVNLVSLKRK